MKTKTKIEVAVVVLWVFAVVIAAPMILRQIGNETGKMLIKPFFYILLAGAPFLVSKIMKNPIGTLGFKKDELLKQVLIGLGIFTVLALIYTIPILALGENKRMFLDTKRNGIGIIVFYIVYNMICVGLGEETLFRGYLMNRFRVLTNSGKWAVVISSLIFGLWHFPSGQDFVQVIITALIGAVYGTALLKIKKCSTLSLGIAHGLHDSYILILSCILL